MTSRSIREALQAQLVDTERLLALVGNHPVMSVSLQQKVIELKTKLEKIPIDNKEAKIGLFFSGKPVLGSIGIDAYFAGQVLEPFQKMVRTDFAQRVSGRVGGRGPAKNNDQSQLFITALPRGSFGIELTKLQSFNLFDEDQLADTLVHLTRLVEAAAKSDEDFAVELDETAARTINSLKEFLKVIKDEEAGIKIESGGVRCELSPEQARIAYDRVAATQTDDDEITLTGNLKGVLLESMRFDFVPEDGEKFSGRIDESLSDDEVAPFFNQNCKATFQVASVRFQNGKPRTSYRLLKLETNII